MYFFKIVQRTDLGAKAGYENSTNSKLNLTISEGAQHSLPEISSWLLLPILQIFTFFYNIGLGSLTWTVATEILPARYTKPLKNIYKAANSLHKQFFRSRIYTHTLCNVVNNFCWFLVTKTFHDIQVSDKTDYFYLT